MPMLKDAGQVSPPLVGTPANPARDPSVTARAGKDGQGSIGDRALMDSVILIGVAWVLLLMLFWSLRNHNV